MKISSRYDEKIANGAKLVDTDEEARNLDYNIGGQLYAKKGETNGRIVRI